METGLEFFDSWAKSQKEFLETSLKSQEEFRAHWLDTMKKMQASFLQTAGSPENPQSREMLNFFNTWLNSMMNSTEVFSDEVVKIQRTWQKTLENQMEMSKELAKNFSDYFKRAEQQ